MGNVVIVFCLQGDYIFLQLERYEELNFICPREINLKCCPY